MGSQVLTLCLMLPVFSRPDSAGSLFNKLLTVKQYCIVFNHFYSASRSMSLSEALPNKSITLCRSLHAEALQATVSEGLAQGSYMYVAARAGFDPTTLRSKGIDSANEPT